MQLLSKLHLLLYACINRAIGLESGLYENLLFEVFLGYSDPGFWVLSAHRRLCTLRLSGYRKTSNFRIPPKPGSE